MASLFTRSLLGTLVAGALLLGALAGPVSAAPVTPNGFCGALNMIVKADVLGDQRGMFHAMSVNNANGNTGMSIAVGNSDCS